MGFDLDSALFAGEPVAEAAPGPVFRFLDETACNRIAVDVAELFYELALGEDVEVVVADLPELLAVAFEGLRGLAFEDVQGAGEGPGFRFAEEEMDVLGHEDVAEDVEAVASPELFECGFEGGAGVVVAEKRETLVTAEGDEVVVAFGLVAPEIFGHVGLW